MHPILLWLRSFSLSITNVREKLGTRWLALIYYYWSRAVYYVSYDLHHAGFLDFDV